MNWVGGRRARLRAKVDKRRHGGYIMPPHRLGVVQPAALDNAASSSSGNAMPHNLSAAQRHPANTRAHAETVAAVTTKHHGSGHTRRNCWGGGHLRLQGDDEADEELNSPPPSQPPPPPPPPRRATHSAAATDPLATPPRGYSSHWPPPADKAQHHASRPLYERELYRPEVYAASPPASPPLVHQHPAGGLPTTSDYKPNLTSLPPSPSVRSPIVSSNESPSQTQHASTPPKRRDDASLLLMLAGDPVPSPHNDNAADAADWSRLLFRPGPSSTDVGPTAAAAMMTPPKPQLPHHISPPRRQSPPQQPQPLTKPATVDKAMQTLPPPPSPLTTPNDTLRNDLAYLSVLLACARHHDKQ